MTADGQRAVAAVVGLGRRSAAAGWAALGVARTGEPYADALAGYPHVDSFAAVDLAAD